MSGFIDPNAGRDERIARLELLIEEALAQTDRSILSPEAQRTLADLESGNAIRRERALRRVHASMAADPLDEEPTDRSPEFYAARIRAERATGPSA